MEQSELLGFEPLREKTHLSSPSSSPSSSLTDRHYYRYAKNVDKQQFTNVVANMNFLPTSLWSPNACVFGESAPCAIPESSSNSK